MFIVVSKVTKQLVSVIDNIKLYVPEYMFPIQASQHYYYTTQYVK